MATTLIGYSVEEYLKLSPYELDVSGGRKPRVDDITHDEFFSDIYAPPSAGDSDYMEMCDRLNDFTESKAYFITGYAGCGKSVLIQKLLYDLGLKDTLRRNTYELVHNFEGVFGIGLKGILELQIRKLSSIMSDDCLSKKQNYSQLRYNMIQQFSASEKLMVSEAIYNKLVRFSQSRAINDVPFSNRGKLSTCLRAELKALFANDMNTDVCERIQGVILLDCLWRNIMSRREHDYKARSYIVYDNLDLVEGNPNTVLDFISCVFSVIEKINDGGIFEDTFPSALPFKFIIAARKVTYAQLQGRIQRDAADISRFYERKDISDFYSFSDIFLNRAKYLKKRKEEERPLKLTDSIGKMENIERMSNTKFVNTKFKQMFNFNYRACIDELSRLNGNDLSKKIEPLISHVPPVDADPDDDNYEFVTHSGASSLFLRAVLDDFDSTNLFEEYQLVEIENTLNKNLSELPITKLTSLTRIILTYLYNDKIKKANTKSEKGVSLSSIFDYFENIYTPHEITEIVIKLQGKNRKWRRPIFVKRIDLEKWKTSDISEALSRMRDLYIHDKAQGMVIFSDEYAEIEICDAGMTYVDFISAHFEFFSLRKKGLDPLFSVVNPVSEGEGFLFESIIADTINSARLCISRLAEFNNRVINLKGFRSYADYLNSPLVGSTRKGNKQFHEERILFQHIYLIEDYRQFIVNKDRIKENPALRKRANEKLVKAIREYLNLLEGISYIWEYRRDIKKALCAKTKRIEDSRYVDFSTRIEA